MTCISLELKNNNNDWFVGISKTNGDGRVNIAKEVLLGGGNLWLSPWWLRWFLSVMYPSRHGFSGVAQYPLEWPHNRYCKIRSARWFAAVRWKSLQFLSRPWKRWLAHSYDAQIDNDIDFILIIIVVHNKLALPCDSGSRSRWLSEFNAWSLMQRSHLLTVY